MMETDFAKEANALHMEFHRVIDKINKLLDKVENGEDIKQAIETIHRLFDNLVIWIEKMQKTIYKLEGRLEESRDAIHRTYDFIKSLFVYVKPTVKWKEEKQK